jgi:exonuclease VII large subunit
MAEKKEEKKGASLATDVITHKEITALCNSWGIKIGEFPKYSMQFFKKTGINPNLPIAETPTEAVKGLTKKVNEQMTNFKRWEDDKYEPLLDNLKLTIKKLSDVIDNKVIKEQFDSLKGSINSQVNQLKEQHKKTIELTETYYDHHISALRDYHDRLYTEMGSRLDKSESAYKGIENQLLEMNKILVEKLSLKGVIKSLKGR